MQVSETISVDFANNLHHGIYRDIPNIYQDASGNQTYVTIDVSNVLIDNYPGKYWVSQNGGYEEIKIGDPQKQINGVHSYTISYTVTGALKSFNDHDELYWNVTGNNWTVPLSKVSATVTLFSPQIEQTKCFQGISGTADPCQKDSTNKQKVTFQTTRPLQLNEGLTIVVGYTKGLVPILLGTKPQTFGVSNLPATPFDMTVFSLVLGVSCLLLLFILSKNNNTLFSFLKPKPPVVVAFEPPNSLRPGELGTLMDEKADTLDVTATIIDLATRGFMTITEQKKTWIFGSTDYILSKTNKETNSLHAYENTLLTNIFSDGKDISIASLKTTFYTQLATVKKQLYEDVVTLNLFDRSPESVRNTYSGIAIGIITAGGILISVGHHVGILFAVGAGVLIPGVLLLFFSRLMAKRSTTGQEVYQRGLGYKLFVKQAERYRQQYFEKENILNEVLPYAIIFGVTEKFAKALKDMGIKPIQPTWYYGIGPFDPYLFGRNISGFSNSFSSAIAATPRGSGLSSGGGFSGGGFGGGGGGSW